MGLVGTELRLKQSLSGNFRYSDLLGRSRYSDLLGRSLQTAGCEEGLHSTYFGTLKFIIITYFGPFGSPRFSKKPREQDSGESTFMGDRTPRRVGVCPGKDEAAPVSEL